MYFHLGVIENNLTFLPQTNTFQNYQFCNSEEENKKDNPKEIFYEFFKIVRRKVLFGLSFPPQSKLFISCKNDFWFSVA